MLPVSRRISFASSLRRAVVAVSACAAALASVCAPLSARADVKGVAVPHSSKPFTETVKAMARRDSLKPRPRKNVIFAPPERDEEAEKIKAKNPESIKTVFPAPRFAGKQGGYGIMSLGAGFTGLTMNDEFTLSGTAYIPPDTTGTVGPNHFMETINGGVAIYSKAGTRLSFVSADSFFAVSTTFPAGGSGTSDPRLVYDRRSGRWFACAIDLSNTNNQCCLAVSRTSDPTGTWDKYLFTIGDPVSFGDYESLAVDDNGVYFGANEFSGGSATPRIFATPKASLIAASPTLGTVTAFTPTDMFQTPQPALNYDAVGPTDRAWFVASSTTDFGNVNYATLTWSGGTPTLSATSVLSTPGYAGFPPNAATSGATHTIDTGDDRIMMAVIRNGRLWAARDVGVDSTGGTSTPDRSACEWLELDVTTATAALVQSGRVYDPSASPRHYFYPSVMVNGQGHATVAFSGTKSTEFISAYFCQRLKTDSAGTMGAITTIKSGTASYDVTFSGTRNRWGDYSFTTLDPADDQTIWTIQEYATTHPASSPSGGWATWITRTLAPAPTLNNPGGSGAQGQTGVTLNLTGTNFYDPGAGFTKRLQVQLTGGATNGISNYVTTYNSPTSATVTFNISASATVGTRDIKLTNPDGQFATVVGGFNVTASAGASSVLTVADAAGSVGGTANLQATLTDGMAGISGKSITVKVDGVEAPGSPATTNGSGVVTLPYAIAEGTVGAHTISAAFAGDGTYPAASGSGTLTVSKSNTTLLAADVNGTAGQAVTLSATLTRDSDSGPLSGKTVTFKVGATTVGTGTTNTSGVATKSYTIPSTDPSGPQTITADFAGDANYNSSTDTGALNVTAKTTLTITNITGSYGATASLKATLKSAGVALPSKSVAFKIDGAVVGSATTNSSGVASLPHVLSESIGVHVLKAEFAGDASYAPSTSSNGSLTVNKATPKVTVTALTVKYSANTTLKATLKSGTTVLVGETLTFKLDGVTLGTAVTNSTGLATVPHNVTESVGLHTITVEFGGNTNYNTATGTGTLTVQVAPTKVTADVVKKTANMPATYGAKLTRTTDNTVLAGKTLEFYDAATSTLIGTGTTDAAGRATITVTAPGVGAKLTITVKFTGDSLYAASTGTGSITGL